jgi:DNA-binding LytR/AlgR family response regulator
MVKDNIRVLVVEDEKPAAGRLIQMIKEEFSLVTIDHCSSISETTKYLKSSEEKIDLIFMDIRLGDGLCFEIFNQVKVISPVIFTTAYDEYAIQAFKVNSVDYLLKPIDPQELHEAIQKFKLHNRKQDSVDFNALTQLILNSGQTKYFFSKQGDKTHIIKETEIVCFYSEDGYTHCRTENGLKYILEESLDEINEFSTSGKFFRVNRSILIRKDCIKSFEPYFNNRLVITTIPTHHDQIIVAREKVKDFKLWLRE